MIRQLSPGAAALLICMVAWTALAAAYCVYRGSTYDYPAYVVIWELFLGGGDPWLGSLPARNAYGPLNVILAPLLLVSPLMPKVAVVTAFLVVNVLVVWRIAAGERLGWRIAVYALLIPLNGAVIIWGIAYGSNDILVAGLVGLAMLLRMDERMLLVGVVLGLAVLLKFYPALLVLLFSIDRRSISWRLLLSSGITVVCGLLAPFVIWGGNSLNWLLFAAERGTSQLSIWNLILNESSLSAAHYLASIAINFNVLMLVLVFGSWLALVWILRISWLPASVFGLLIVLILYKVGHGQFWVTWLILACGLLIAIDHKSMRLAVACVPAAVGVSLAPVVYDVRLQMSLPWDQVQRQVGWIVFGLLVVTMVAFLTILLRGRDSDSHTPGQNRTAPASISS